MSPLITTTVGPRNAHTDSKTGLRFYNWEGRDLPSVTSIRRMAGLPFFLHEWTISQVVGRAVERHAELGVMLTRDRAPREHHASLDAKRIREAKTWLRKAATEARDVAADLGTRVHDAAAKGVGITDADPDVAAKLHQYYNWLDESGAEIIASEKQVWNLTLGYAGTFDLLVRMPNGDIYLVDLKTGKRTYSEHALQLIAYCMAEHIGEDNVIDEDLTTLLHSINGMALLHLGDEQWKWQEIQPRPEMFRAFRGLLVFSKFAHEFQAIDDLVEESAEGSA